jgi:hypothetical protein
LHIPERLAGRTVHTGHSRRDPTDLLLQFGEIAKDPLQDPDIYGDAFGHLLDEAEALTEQLGLVV